MIARVRGTSADSIKTQALQSCMKTNTHFNREKNTVAKQDYSFAKI